MSIWRVPFYSVLGATVNDDMTGVSNDEFNALNALLANQLAGSVDSVHTVDLSYYRHEGV